DRREPAPLASTLLRGERGDRLRRIREITAGGHRDPGCEQAGRDQRGRKEYGGPVQELNELHAPIVAKGRSMRIGPGYPPRGTTASSPGSRLPASEPPAPPPRWAWSTSLACRRVRHRSSRRNASRFALCSPAAVCGTA